MRHLQVSYLEVRNMSIRYRQWFISRYIKELNDKKEVQEISRNKRNR